MQKRKPGRPKTNPTSIHLTLLPDQLVRLDAFIAEQDDKLTRAEGVRRVLDEALPAASFTKPASAAKPTAGAKAASRARAGQGRA
jgi:hypothetical protein